MNLSRQAAGLSPGGAGRYNHAVLNVLPIPIPLDRISEFGRRHHIRRLSLFGSVLRDDFGPDSDVDMLVEFSPENTPDLFTLARMQADLSDLIGRNVDLRTPNELSRFFRDRVLAEAKLIHGVSRGIRD